MGEVSVVHAGVLGSSPLSASGVADASGASLAVTAGSEPQAASESSAREQRADYEQHCKKPFHFYIPFFSFLSLRGILSAPNTGSALYGTEHDALYEVLLDERVQADYGQCAHDHGGKFYRRRGGLSAEGEHRLLLSRGHARLGEQLV